jgi:endonuclease III
VTTSPLASLISAFGDSPFRTGGALPLGNQTDPLDELFFIIITTMTQYGAETAFAEMKAWFSSWDDLLLDDAEAKMRAVISRCGLVNQKVPQVLQIARQLQSDFGSVTLDPLRQMPNEEAEQYLLSLPRVGKKVARCVLMYSLGREVLPVDAHVLRLSKRLGLLPPNLTWAKAHDAIHEAVPPELRYSVHVGLVEHGRTVCTHKKPRCGECLLGGVCPSRQDQSSEAKMS